MLVLVAGCGGGDSRPKLTKAEFIAKGDKLCNDFRAHQPAGVPIANWADLKRGSENAADAEAKFRDSFGGLNAPADGRTVRDHVVAYEDRVVKITRTVADLAAKPSANTRATIGDYANQLRSIGDQMRAELLAYGFKVCSQPRSV